MELVLFEQPFDTAQSVVDQSEAIHVCHAHVNEDEAGPALIECC